MTRTVVRLLPSLPRPTLPGVSGLGVAGAVAFTLLGHAHELVSHPPTRKSAWWALLVLLTAVLWPIARRLVTVVVPTLRGAGRLAVALPVAVGVFLPVWWAGRTTDLLWIHRDLAAPLRTVLPVAEAVTAAAIAAGLLAAVIATDPPATRRPPRTGRPWLVAGLFAVAAVGFAGGYVAQERTVYACDFMYYWTLTADWAAAGGWEAFRTSVQQPGYSLLPCVALAAAMALLGDHRAVYVAAVAAAYLTGLAAAAGWFTRTVGGGRFTAVVPAGLLFTMPMAWAPVLRGYPDVGGAALAVLAVGLYLCRPRTELRWPHLLGAAAALAGMALFRRWYNFFAVAFLLTIAADAAVGAARPLFAGRWRAAAREARPAVVVGGLFALLLIAVAWPMVRLTAAADYADAHAGYRSPVPWWERTAAVVRGIGPGYWLAAGVSLVGLLGNPATRRPALVLAAPVPVLLVHFQRTQDMNGHHTYLLLPALLLLPSLALVRLLARLPGWAGGVGLVGVVGLAAAAAIPVFLPGTDAPRTPLGSNAEYPPLTRDDRAEFERLLDFLAADGGRFYCLSSSTDLHYSLFQSAGRSLRRPFPADRLEPTQEVDRTHGFPAGLFRADLLLVADPVQLHLRPGEQQTILVPHRQLTAGVGIGRAFDELPERFHLQHGVTVRVFRRARPIDPADREALSAELRAAHPDRPFVWRPTP